MESSSTPSLHTCDLTAHTSTYKCLICDTTRPHQFRLEPPPDTACTHPNQICSLCWDTWIESQLATKRPTQLRCAQCPNLLRQEEVRAFAPRDVYERYLDLLFKATLRTIPNFHFCIRADCSSGQIHDFDNCGSTLMCYECCEYQCFTCKTFEHPGKTCAEMRATLRSNHRHGDSWSTISRTTKSCPNCQVPIEHAGGCDQMTCINCEWSFCWLCLGKAKEGHHCGKGEHHEECRYWLPKESEDGESGVVAEGVEEEGGEEVVPENWDDEW